MDGLGLLVRIPDCQAPLRQGRFEYMRRIDAVGEDNYYLAILIGAVDTGTILQIIGILPEGNYSHLLRVLSENGELVLGHHSLRYFREIKRSLQEAAYALKLACRQQALPILVENANAPQVPGAAFQVTQLNEQFFVNLYSGALRQSRDALLCCGCSYSRDIYQQGFQNFRPPCLHHDPLALKSALWEVREVPCEKELERAIMSGATLQQCAKCERSSFTFVVAGACLQGCSLCFDCIAQGSREMRIPSCVKCGNILLCDRVLAAKGGCIMASALQDQTLLCRRCRSPRHFPLHCYSDSAHKDCAICPKCQLDNPGFCGDCDRPTGNEEGMITKIAHFSNNCWLCFGEHDCKEGCILCYLNGIYIIRYGNQLCAVCSRQLNVVECPKCRCFVKYDQMQRRDTEMCQGCVDKMAREMEAYQSAIAGSEGQAPPAAYISPEESAARYQPPMPPEEGNREVAQLPPQQSAAPSDPTPQGPGCVSCGEIYSDTQEVQDIEHACSSGRWCLWCFAKRIIMRTDSDKCPDCEKHIIEVIPIANKLDMYCESCNLPHRLGEFLNRSRCGHHVVCKSCFLKTLEETNGYFQCSKCSQFPPSSAAPCTTPGCTRLSSRAVHAIPSLHPLCWACALASFSVTVEICSCGKPLANMLREALCMQANSTCIECQSLRPLVTLPCGCQKRTCAYCVKTVEDQRIVCPGCREQFYVPPELLQTQLQKCVGCLGTDNADGMLDCKHSYHSRCFTRAGKCEMCLRLKSRSADLHRE